MAEDKLLKKVKEQAERGILFNKDNMDVYFASQNFLFSKDGQFTSAELDYFTKHNKPSLVVNRLILEYYRTLGAMAEAKRNVRLSAIGGMPDDPMTADQLQERIKLRQNLIESISCHSEANKVYLKAIASSYFGIGAVRISRQYESDESFNQCLKIQYIKKPQSIYWDPNGEVNCTDDKKSCEYMGYYEDLTPDEINSIYDVDVKDPLLQQSTFGTVDGKFTWIMNQNTGQELFRVCHHYYKKYFNKKIALLSDGRQTQSCELKDVEEKLKELNESVAMKESQMGMQLPSYTKVKERTAKTFVLKEIIFCGNKILEKPMDWVCKLHPISLFLSTSYTDEEGKFHTIPQSYFGEDVQRLQNFTLSALVESLTRFRTERFVMEKANLPENDNDKAKWINPDQQEGVFYVQANNAFPKGFDIIPSKEIPMGVLQTAQIIPQIYNDTIGRSPSSQMSTGGLNSSGSMIDSVAREDNQIGAFYENNSEDGILYVAKVINAAIPAVYDSYRQVNINNSDKVNLVTLNDPDKPESMIGDESYEVSMTVGPAFEVQRNKTAEILSQALVAQPQLISVLGDKWAKNLDIDDAQDIADRMYYIMDPRILQKLGVHLPPSPPPQQPPQPPPNPMQMQMLQLKQSELQLKQQDLQLRAQKLSLDAQNSQAQQQLDQERQANDLALAQVDKQLEMMRIQNDMYATQMDVKSTAIKSHAEIIRSFEQNRQRDLHA